MLQDLHPPGTTTWSGQYGGGPDGTPPGCPAIDPIAVLYSIAPGGTTTLTDQEGDTIPDCQASGLKSTVNVNGAAGTVATATASPSIVQPVSPPGFCHVTY